MSLPSKRYGPPSGTFWLSNNRRLSGDFLWTILDASTVVHAQCAACEKGTQQHPAMRIIERRSAFNRRTRTHPGTASGCWGGGADRGQIGILYDSHRGPARTSGGVCRRTGELARKGAGGRVGGRSLPTVSHHFSAHFPLAFGRKCHHRESLMREML